MYQVVASDLDGTLLSPDHFLTPYAKETLKLLTARGINFVFATGRHYIDVGQIRDNLGIRSYMITSNGARVHDSDGQQIFAHNLDRDIAADLFEIVRNDPKIVTNVYREDEWYMNRHRPEEMRFFKEAVFNYKLYEPGELDPQGISKVFFTCEDHEHLLPLGRSRERQLLHLTLPGSHGGWGIEGACAGGGSENARLHSCRLHRLRRRYE